MTIAATSPDNSAAPGTLGFLVVFGLAVVLTFVFWSMSRHIRRVNEAARRDEEAQAAARDKEPGQAAAASSDSQNSS